MIFLVAICEFYERSVTEYITWLPMTRNIAERYTKLNANQRLDTFLDTGILPEQVSQ